MNQLKRIEYNQSKQRIEIHFPFSIGMRKRVKALPDPTFDWDDNVWCLPVSYLHATQAVVLGRDLGFFVDSKVLAMTRVNIPRNKSIREKMRPFQRLGLDFLHASGGRAILADDMGLGKTIQSIAWVQESNFKKVLVVAPASVTFMWKEKFEEWSGWDSVNVIQGYTNPYTDARILICSYSVFTNRVHDLNKLGFELVIYDECHNLSNTKTSRYKAAKILQTPHLLGLSGTPFLNRPKELFAELNLVNPYTWNSFFKYARRYCAAHETNFGWDFNGASNLDELREKTEHIMLRRTKNEVLHELPEITRTYLPYMNETKTLITEYTEAFKAALAQPRSSTHNIFLGVRKPIGMMKIAPAVELAKDVLNSSKKIVLFAVHKDVVAGLAEGLKEYGLIKIIGDTPMNQRHNLVSQFQTVDDIRVAIISEAGGEGINLFAADTLIFVEREWNPGKEMQIEGRIHRMGQNNACKIYYIIARGTIDEQIHKLIMDKRDVLGSVMNLDDITTEDLLFLE